MGQFLNNPGGVHIKINPAEAVSELHVPEAWNIRSEAGAWFLYCICPCSEQFVPSKKGTVPIFFQLPVLAFQKYGSSILLGEMDVCVHMLKPPNKHRFLLTL